MACRCEYLPLLAALVFGLASCGEPSTFQPPKGMTQAASEHFEYWSHPDDMAVCDGTLAVAEQHYRTLRGFLGFEPADEKVAYYKFRSQDELDRFGVCGSGASACFRSEWGIFADEALHLHELIHSYLQIYGDQHPLLEEGAAQALSCGERATEFAVTDLDLDDAFDQQFWQQAGPARLRQLYQAGSLLVAQLLRAAGGDGDVTQDDLHDAGLLQDDGTQDDLHDAGLLQDDGTQDDRLPQAEHARRFIEWYRSVSRFDDAAVARETFEAIYGRSLDATWSAALEANEPDAACVRIWECSDPFNQTLGFDEVVEKGPAGRQCAADRFTSFDLTEPTLLSLTTEESATRLGSCAHQAMPHDHLLGAFSAGHRSSSAQLGLDAGRYFVASEAETFTLTATALPDVLSAEASCAEAQPLETELDPDVIIALDRAILAATEPAGPLTLRWSDAGFSSARYFFECSEGLGAAACAGCPLTTAADSTADGAPLGGDASDPSGASSVGTNCQDVCGRTISFVSFAAESPSNESPSNESPSNESPSNESPSAASVAGGNSEVVLRLERGEDPTAQSSHWLRLRRFD